MIHSGGIRGLIIASVTLHRDSVPRMSRDRRQTTADGGIQRHLIDIGMSDVSAARRPVSPFTNECPRQDSNLRTRLRRPLLYPLSYGGSGGARVPGSGTRSCPGGSEHMNALRGISLHSWRTASDGYSSSMTTT